MTCANTYTRVLGVKRFMRRRMQCGAGGAGGHGAAPQEAGVSTVRDALLFFPFRYDDFSAMKPIAELSLR